MTRILLILLAATTMARAANPIPPNWMPTDAGWFGVAGIKTPITNRPVAVVLSGTNTVTGVANAIAAAANETTIVLSNDQAFTFSSVLNVTRGSVSIVGLCDANGRPSTVVNGRILVGPAFWDWDKPTNTQYFSWIGGLTRGSTNLTISTTNWAGSSATIPVGSIVFLEQSNVAYVSAYGDYGSPNGNSYRSFVAPGNGYDRWQHQPAVVTASSAGSITIDHAVAFTNISASLAPAVWYEPTTPVKQVQVANIHFNVNNSSGAGIAFQYCDGFHVTNCWVSAAKRGVYPFVCCNGLVEHCYFDTDSGSHDDYPFAPWASGYITYQNSSTKDLHNSVSDQGMVGGVIAYNCWIGTNAYNNGNVGEGAGYTHGGNPSFNLWEGNIWVNQKHDGGWGSSEYQAQLRCALPGFDPDDTHGYYNYLAAGIVGATNNFTSWVGCVMGTPSMHRNFVAKENDSPRRIDSGTYGGSVLYYGFLHYGHTTVVYDPAPLANMISAVCWVSSTNADVFAGPGIYFNGYLPADVPNSLYLSSKPSWFGTMTWPPIDPSMGTNAYNIAVLPAGYRALNAGVDPPASAPAPTTTININSAIVGTLTISGQ